MAIKYIPYYPNTIEGQAILDNITRSRRVLTHRDSGKVSERIKRGLPLYETRELEQVGAKNENLLIRGECITACAYLQTQGVKLDLVYIDPPFASGADYAKKIYLRSHPKKAAELAALEERMQAGEDIELEELKAFEEKMYGDIWNKADYLNWMFENLMAIKSVMNDTSSIYVHLDWHIGHYVKVLMDEIFGENNFINEIIWHYPGREMHIENKFNAKHDTLLLYGKSEGVKVNMAAVAIPHDREERLKSLRRKVHKDEDDREWVWETRGQAAGQEAYKRYVDDIIADGQALSDVWSDIQFLRGNDPQRTDYATQKPENLLERVIKASSKEGMVVADFFGGSGVTASVAKRLNRKFIHVDIGINSIQTARDRMLQNGASFTVLDIQDGVSLFRNPIQTMDKLKTLITGLKNEDSLEKFWEGAIQDSKLGLLPVYIPNLLDHATKILDVPLINRVLQEAIPELPDDVKKVVVYYVDIDDEKAVTAFLKENNMTGVEIELRDLKQVLDDVVINDEITYKVTKGKEGFTVDISHFISDRLTQKIEEYNAKRKLQSKPALFDDDGNPIAKAAPSKPIVVSDDGLELIEFLSLDCQSADESDIWHSDEEIKIDKKGFTIRNGKKTAALWDGSIQSKKKPLRLKVRNIAGDESIVTLK